MDVKLTDIISELEFTEVRLRQGYSKTEGYGRASKSLRSVLKTLKRMERKQLGKKKGTTIGNTEGD